MASYFGRRDFGDPRHNFGRPVPPLNIPSQFPGQTSWPSLRRGAELVPPGIDEQNGGTKHLASRAKSRPVSPRKSTPKITPNTRLLTMIDSTETRSSARTISAYSASPVSARSQRSSRQGSARRPKSDHSHPAGVEELMRLGFPRAAAEAAFQRVNGTYVAPKPAPAIEYDEEIADDASVRSSNR